MNIMAVRWGRLYEGTEAELSLEDAIGAIGVPYRFQFPGWKYGLRYFPDFILPTLKLVIEVDDASHNKSEKQLADEERTRDIYREWGYRVVRCTNAEALNDPHGTVKGLLAGAGCWPLPDRRPRVKDSLPEIRRAGRRAKREAASAARQSRRSKSSEPSEP